MSIKAGRLTQDSPSSGSGWRGAPVNSELHDEGRGAVSPRVPRETNPVGTGAVLQGAAGRWQRYRQVPPGRGADVAARRKRPARRGSGWRLAARPKISFEERKASPSDLFLE